MLENVKIEAAETQDMNEFLKAHYKDFPLVLLRSNPLVTDTWKVTVDGQVVGYGCIHYKGTIANVGGLSVLPAYRGQGLCTQLLKEMIKPENLRASTSCIKSTVTKMSKGIHEKLGFKECGKTFKNGCTKMRYDL